MYIVQCKQGYKNNNVIIKFTVMHLKNVIRATPPKLAHYYYDDNREVFRVGLLMAFFLFFLTLHSLSSNPSCDGLYSSSDSSSSEEREGVG